MPKGETDPSAPRVAFETSFDCLVLAPIREAAGTCLRAIEKAGGTGIVMDLGLGGIEALVEEMSSAGVSQFGMVVRRSQALLESAPSDVPGLTTLLYAGPLGDLDSLQPWREAGVTVLLEVSRWSDAVTGAGALVDGYVLKGHECAGLVTEQTTFILLQQAQGRTAKPLYAMGGISPETAAAAKLAGAAGVVLADEVLLFETSGLTDPKLRKRIVGVSGNDGVQIEDPRGGAYLRGFALGGGGSVAELERAFRADPSQGSALQATFSWDGDGIAPGGQGLALAEPMRHRFGTLGRYLQGIQKAVATLPQAAADRRILDKGAPFAERLGTAYPVIQGPMTRVSDVSDFFGKVAEGGGLPVAALALMRGQEAEKLLSQTAELLGDRPWGVGMLGFADTKVLEPQFVILDKVRPDFAIVAGGRVDQIDWLAERGIKGFVHVAAPWQIADYLDQGVTRFILEGRECGGHIGPLSSFVLWSVLIDAIARHPMMTRSPSKIEVVFAGGIHDALSAAMVSVLAEPLAARGVQIGVLMGTAYLFTEEIVASGAIVPDYQRVALECATTETLWEGGGYASRCAITPATEEFRTKKREMEESGASATEMRKALEHYTLGRLRMATKGVARTGSKKKLTEIGEIQRQAEGMYMIGQVSALRDQVQTIPALHEAVCLGSVALLRDRTPKAAPPVLKKMPEPCDIAIVGMSTLLPGADTLSAYWRRILSGESAIREVPADRWSKIGYYSEDKKERDKIYATRGGFLEDVAFNPLQYGIPPSSIPAIDPMQLLALEVVGDALEDASGGAAEPEDRSRMSVVFGFSGGLGEAGSLYAVRSELIRLFGETVPEEVLSRLPEWTEDSFAGLLPNVASGRIANRFNLGGTNQTVDAACASSLAALYSGVMELESCRADTVVVGGIDTLQSPFGYLCFAKTTALSPRGVCNTFDAQADGIVISEGLAAVVLKRLADAERDGDRIYGVIKGVGSSSDGRAKGLTAPLPAGQKRAFARAYDQAGFPPSAVQLFEAHGTGTVAGDRAELTTVTEMLAGPEVKAQSVAIGSVKTLIGHTKATAGIAGLIKVALGLHHKVLPPHALVKTPNAVFEAADTPLYLSQKPRPWVTRAGAPRRAGVSAFGFGGTNFHVALEEYDRIGAKTADLGEDLGVFAFAAESREALGKKVGLFAKRAGTQSLATLAKAAADTGTGNHRLAFVAKNREAFDATAATAVAFLGSGETTAPRGLHYTDAPMLAEGGKLAFLFSGQGSQYPDMLRQTGVFSSALLGALDGADAVFAATPTGAKLGRDLSKLIYPGEAFTPEARKRQMTALTSTDVAQPALGAIEAGLLGMLSELGLRPDMAAGHSYGEFAALHAAGVLSFEDLITISEARGRAMVENGDPERPGAMLAVSADKDATAKAIAGLDDVVIANLNSPRQTVIAGSEAGIAKAAEQIEAAGFDGVRVPVSQAFHSPLMNRAAVQFGAALKEVSWVKPQLPVYANATAAPHSKTPAKICAAMGSHITSPVDFVAMVQRMSKDGARVFLEVGPKSVLTSRVPEILGQTPHLAIALDRSSGDTCAVFEALAQLFVAGVAVHFTPLAARLAPVEGRAQPEAAAAKSLWYLNGAYARPADALLRDVSPPQSAPQTLPQSLSVGTAPVSFAPVATPPVAQAAVPALPVAPSLASTAPIPPEEELVFMEIKPPAFLPPVSGGGKRRSRVRIPTHDGRVLAGAGKRDAGLSGPIRARAPCHARPHAGGRACTSGGTHACRGDPSGCAATVSRTCPQARGGSARRYGYT